MNKIFYPLVNHAFMFFCLLIIMTCFFPRITYAQTLACLPGYVWRQATPNDKVCVTPQSRALVATENSLANSRRESGPRNGSYYCLTGYVWREAFVNDQVCVIPAARDRVTRENAKANSRVVGKPDYKTPGTRVLEIGVVNSRFATDEKTFKSICQNGVPLIDGLNSMVGWGQAEIGWLGQACFAFSLEKAVLFDRTLLDKVPNKKILRVILTYDETEAPSCPLVGFVSEHYRCWQDGNEHYQYKQDGCIVVRVPTVDWIQNGGNYKGRLPAAEGQFNGIKRLNARTWDVTEQLSWQLDRNSIPFIDPSMINSFHVGYGLLLAGSRNLNQLTAQDNTVCVSELQNVALEVTYEVMPPVIDNSNSPRVN